MEIHSNASKVTQCIYCSEFFSASQSGDGEHIIQRALGGKLGIYTVCRECNNGFSDIDRELCSRSLMAVVASHQGQSKLWQVWDVDHANSELLLEASPDWSRQSLTQYPQIVFERSGPQIRGDFEQIQRFGVESFVHLIVKAATRAYRYSNRGVANSIIFDEVDAASPALKRYRLPPRLYRESTIEQLAQKIGRKVPPTFTLRYSDPVDKRRALHALGDWDATCRRANYLRGGVMRTMSHLGSQLPALRVLFDCQKTLRAILKMAFNMLAYCCPSTPVNCREFPDVVARIRGNVDIVPKELSQAGFVHASDLQHIARPGSHSFHLFHANQRWFIRGAFFGGAIGTAVHFAGPNRELVNSIKVTAPIGSKNWEIERSLSTEFETVQVDWHNPKKIMPSVPIFY